jgi:hypothetical protein
MTTDPLATDPKAIAAGRRLIFIILGVVILLFGSAYLLVIWVVPSNDMLMMLVEHMSPGLIPSSSYARNLDSGNVDLMRESLGLLRRRKDPIAVDRAIELLKHPDDYVWLNAADYLGALKREEAVPYLIKALRHTASRSDQETAGYLKNITKLDFGTDFDKWQGWWITGHPGMKFDWESALGPMPRLPEDRLPGLDTKERSDMEFQRASGVQYSNDHDELLAVVFEKLTDADLHRVKPYLEKSKKSLQELILGGEGVSDAALDDLQGLANLRRLTLIGTSVTDAGLSRLRKALPKVEVVRLPRGSTAPTPLPPS